MLSFVLFWGLLHFNHRVHLFLRVFVVFCRSRNGFKQKFFVSYLLCLASLCAFRFPPRKPRTAMMPLRDHVRPEYSIVFSASQRCSVFLGSYC